MEQRLHSVTHRLRQALEQQLQEKQLRFARTVTLLHALSPLATLGRGYAIVRSVGPRPRLLTSASQVQPGDRIEALLQQGIIVGVVEKTEENQEETGSVKH